jgi:hypothetical protein
MTTIGAPWLRTCETMWSISAIGLRPVDSSTGWRSRHHPFEQRSGADFT